MPAAADIGRLVFFLGHGSDFFIAFNFWEKPIDVYLTPALGKFNMLLWADILVTEKHQSIIDKAD